MRARCWCLFGLSSISVVRVGVCGPVVWVGSSGVHWFTDPEVEVVSTLGPLVRVSGWERNWSTCWVPWVVALALMKGATLLLFGSFDRAVALVSMGCRDVCVRAWRGRAAPCCRVWRESASVRCAWPAGGPRCCGRLCARAVCVILGCAGSGSLLGCAVAVARVCGAPCESAGGAVGRPEQALEEFTCSVSVVARAGGAAAARSRAGGETVLGVPVGPRADECVVSASVQRRARASGRVAGIFTCYGVFNRFSE